MDGPEKNRIGSLLVSQGILTDEQLKAVVDEQRRTNRKIGRVIADAGLATEESVARTLAQQLHASFVDLRTFTTKPELVKLLPEALARRHRALVLDSKDGRLVIGFADPTDPAAIEEIKRAVQREILLAVVTESDLMSLMSRAYQHAEKDQDDASTEDELSAEDKAKEDTFDICVSLPVPVEKEILQKRLVDNIGIEADKLDELVCGLTDRRTVKIRTDVTRVIADKVGDDCRRAGLAVDIRECLRLIEVHEKVAEEVIIQCPACGAIIAAADNLKCPSCHLIINKEDETSEYALKKKIKDEERGRIELRNAQSKKSNEELQREENEQKLRDEIRAQLEIKKQNDLIVEREKAVQKRNKIRLVIQISSALVLLLVLAFGASRWSAPKTVQPPVSSQSAPAVAFVENKSVNRAGRVELVEGDVHLVDRDKKQRSVKIGDVLNEGDTIVTGKGGELHIKMRDEGFIAVRQNTDLQIVAYRAQGDDQDRGVFSLAKGSFRSVTGWIGKFNAYAYQVKTPTATIGVRGTDHEPLVILADSKEGEPGTYDKVNIGSSYMETPQGSVDVPAGKAAFSPSQVKPEKMVPRLLAEIPKVFQPTHNEKSIDPRHDAIQKIVGQERDIRHKQVEQVCRKE